MCGWISLRKWILCWDGKAFSTGESAACFPLGCTFLKKVRSTFLKKVRSTFFKKVRKNLSCLSSLSMS
jgi:hypothetical protein